MNLSKLPLAEQERIFDECVAECSPEAQRELNAMVVEFDGQLARGGGEQSAKSLVLSLVLYPKINETIESMKGTSDDE